MLKEGRAYEVGITLPSLQSRHAKTENALSHRELLGSEADHDSTLRWVVEEDQDTLYVSDLNLTEQIESAINYISRNIQVIIQSTKHMDELHRKIAGKEIEEGQRSTHERIMKATPIFGPQFPCYVNMNGD